MYIAVVAVGDSGRNLILKLDTITKNVIEFAGGGSGTSYCCDGSEARSATLLGPNGVAVDKSGTAIYSTSTRHYS